MKLSQILSRNLIIGAFITVPFLTSIVSTIHMVDLFDLGNIGWMSLVLAFAFEIGSLASFMVLTVMDKIKRSIVWTIFLLLAFMQVFGNVYSTYEYVTAKLLENPNWLNSFRELLSFFMEGDMQTFKVTLTCIIAMPISGISLAFLKSLVDYVPSVDEDTTPVTTNAPEESGGSIVELPVTVTANTLPEPSIYPAPGMEIQKVDSSERVKVTPPQSNVAVFQNNI